MLFSSIPFLYYFLPIVMVLYFVVPKCMKNGVLLLASLTFYAWGEPKYVILMIASICVGYISGLLIEAISDLKWKKWILTIAVAVCLGFLAFFKYANFFLENFAALTGFCARIKNRVANRNQFLYLSDFKLYSRRVSGRGFGTKKYHSSGCLCVDVSTVNSRADCALCGYHKRVGTTYA